MFNGLSGIYFKRFTNSDTKNATTAHNGLDGMFISGCNDSNITGLFASYNRATGFSVLGSHSINITDVSVQSNIGHAPIGRTFSQLIGILLEKKLHRYQ